MEARRKGINTEMSETTATIRQILEALGVELTDTVPCIDGRSKDR